jgi:hypothetical protein
MKKKLNTDAISNELKGGSAFFPDYHQDNSPSPATEVGLPETPDLPKTQKQPNDDTMIPRHHDTMVSSNHDTAIPLTEVELLEVVRRAVKQNGKEGATYRFTKDEKNNLTDIKYTYKRQGIETSENEITRIALNYLFGDYKMGGEQSILAKILRLLNS